MDDRIYVVGVIGSTAKIFGLPSYLGIRPLLETRQFPHYGAAKLFADEYEDRQRSFQKSKTN